jgi:hypothetical protein
MERDVIYCDLRLRNNLLNYLPPVQIGKKELETFKLG